MIYVRTKEGRKAYFRGRVIPNDQFIPVPDTPRIRRMLNHWEDLEMQGDDKKKEKEPDKAKIIGTVT